MRGVSFICLPCLWVLCVPLILNIIKYLNYQANEERIECIKIED